MLANRRLPRHNDVHGRPVQSAMDRPVGAPPRPPPMPAGGDDDQKIQVAVLPRVPLAAEPKSTTRRARAARRCAAQSRGFAPTISRPVFSSALSFANYNTIRQTAPPPVVPCRSQAPEDVKNFPIAPLLLVLPLCGDTPP